MKLGSTQGTQNRDYHIRFVWFQGNSKSVFEFNFETGTFDQLQTLNSITHYPGSSAAELPDQSYLISGGFDPQHSAVTTGTYHFFENAYHQKGEMNVGRTRHASHYHGGFVYVFGGIAVEGPTNSCEVFDMNNNVWVAISPMNQPRYNASVCKVGADKFFVFGGRDQNEQPLLSIEVFDISTGEWTTIGAVCPEPICHSAI